MINPNMLDDLAQKLGSVLPDGVQVVQRDIEKNFKTILQNSFARMDLVTREEFDVQAEVLRRSRDKLDKMEQQIAELEAKLSNETN